MCVHCLTEMNLIYQGNGFCARYTRYVIQPHIGFCLLCGFYICCKKDVEFLSRVHYCSFPGCDRPYHLRCLFKSRRCMFAKMQCPKHFCDVCKSTEDVTACFRCVRAYCKNHLRGNLYTPQPDKPTCWLHFPTFQKAPLEFADNFENRAALVVALEMWKISFRYYAVLAIRLSDTYLWNTLFLHVEIISALLHSGIPRVGQQIIMRAVHFVGNALTRICSRKTAEHFNKMKFFDEWYETSIEKMVYDCCMRRIPVSQLNDLALVISEEVPIIEFCTF